MTKTLNDTETITPASETLVERRPSRKAWWIAGGGIALAVGLGAAALGVSIADAAENDDRDDQTSQVGSVTPTQSSEVRSGDDSRSDDRSDDRHGDDSRSDDNGVGDAPISAAERASAETAAVAEVGEGTITDVDRSDDSDHAWEVEVTFADGRDADVELDADFRVVRVDSDN